MPILDAAFAFALTMLVVATAVAQLVRLLRESFGLRRSELRAMLVQFFTNEVQPVIKQETQRLSSKLGEGVADAVNSAAAEFTTVKSKDLIDGAHALKLVEVSTDELINRLKQTDLGEQVLSKFGEDSQAVFDRLAQRYDAVGKRFSDSFRKWSRRWAMGIALVLALVLNIDSIRIASSYVTNDSLREAVVAKAPQLMENYRTATPSGEDEQVEGTQKAFEQALDDAKNQLDFLANAGFPVGWSQFPYNDLRDQPDDPIFTANNAGRLLTWLLGIALTAALAGLGAPFWYDTVLSISRVVQKTRSQPSSES